MFELHGYGSEVAAEVTRWTVARPHQEIRLVTSAATVPGDFSDTLSRSLSAVPLEPWSAQRPEPFSVRGNVAIGFGPSR